MTTETTRELLKFTRKCKYWDSRKCFNGMSCPFAHSESELREVPSLEATGLCYEFARSGHCRRGQGCHFAHGEHELRSLPSQVAPAVSFVPQTSQNAQLQSMVMKLHYLEEMVGRMMREVHMSHVQHMAGACQGDQRELWASATASTSSNSCYPSMASAASEATNSAAQKSPSEPVACGFEDDLGRPPGLRL